MADMKWIGEKNDFAIAYTFFDNTGDTELSMYVKGRNILAFRRDGMERTTRWNLDSLAEWLRSFLDNMEEDPYPVEAEGEFAAMKDMAARNFDSDSDEEFDAYYDRLDEWNQRHRWHPASDGAVLADVYFQLVGHSVEISWNNENLEENADFHEKLGGAKIRKGVFVDVIEDFLREYAAHWFV